MVCVSCLFPALSLPGEWAFGRSCFGGGRGKEGRYGVVVVLVVVGMVLVTLASGSKGKNVLLVSIYALLAL